MSSEEEDYDYADESEPKESEIEESESVDEGSEAEPEPELDSEYPEVEQVDYSDPLHCRHYIIAPEDRRTDSSLTKEEVSKLLSTRIAQIENNSPVLTDVTGLTNPIDMAKKELVDRKCPLLIRREDTTKRTPEARYFEEWNPNKMGLPDRASWYHK